MPTTAKQQNEEVMCPICWGQKVIWETIAGTKAMIPMQCDECFGQGTTRYGGDDGGEEIPE